MWVIVIVIAFIAITLLNRFLSAEHENRDCLRLYTGGLGSGKTYRAVDCACAAYRKAVLKYKIYKLFHPKKGRKIEKPRLYGCGIRISDRKGNIISEDMTVDHFLQKALSYPGTETSQDSPLSERIPSSHAPRE